MIEIDEETTELAHKMDNAITELWAEVAIRQRTLDLREAKVSSLYQIFNRIIDLAEFLVGSHDRIELLAILQYSIGKSIGSFDADEPSNSYVNNASQLCSDASDTGAMATICEPLLDATG